MNYATFDAILMRRICFISILCIIFLVVITIGMVYLIKNPPPKKTTLDDRLTYWALIGLASIAIIGIIIYGSIMLNESVYDISHKAYIIFEGDFKIVYDNKTSSKQCSIILSDGTRLQSGNKIEEGNYNGRIVYAQKTEYVLAVDFFNSCREFVV